MVQCSLSARGAITPMIYVAFTVALGMNLIIYFPQAPYHQIYSATLSHGEGASVRVSVCVFVRVLLHDVHIYL